MDGLEYLPASSESERKNHILCCQCGTSIEPNPANMCIACLRTRVDVTEGIPRQGTLYFCRACERYLQPPAHWVKAALESRELLGMCLKKLRNLNKVHLVDAGFVWTEPHSKRIKVKLTIQKEVLAGAILQQSFVVEFVVHNHMCTDCHRVEAKDFWRAVVQVRQKATHKKTLFYLEQIILKHKAHAKTTSIKVVSDGIDFFFANKSDAKKLLEFLQAHAPIRYQTAQELVSHDARNNIFDYKHTFSVEVVPACKDSVVCIPQAQARALGNLSQVLVCTRVTQAIHLIDPNTLQVAEMTATMFWRFPFANLCSVKQLTEFIVLEMDVIHDSDRRHIAGSAPLSQKHVLGEVWLMKSSDMNGQQFHCRTHLAHLLQPGDTVLGFDIANSNVNDEHLEKMKPEDIPDVVIVKKVYADSSKRARKRNWKLRHLEADRENKMETASIDREYNDFLEDLEEDAEVRQHVNVYKDPSKMALEVESSDDELIPRISLQEMLDDLHLDDVDMEEPNNDEFA